MDIVGISKLTSQLFNRNRCWQN